jgi:hypothetical protein
VELELLNFQSCIFFFYKELLRSSFQCSGRKFYSRHVLCRIFLAITDKNSINEISFSLQSTEEAFNFIANVTIPSLEMSEGCCRLVVEMKVVYFISGTHKLSHTRADLITKEIQYQHMRWYLLQHPHHSSPHQKAHRLHRHMLHHQWLATNLLHSIIHPRPLHI